MYNSNNFIHRLLDEMIALYPDPKDATTLVASTASSTLSPSMSQSLTDRKPVKSNTAQIRRKFELEEAQLRRTDWTAERLARIPEESLAALAYSLSIPLQVEFGKNEKTFLAYWRSLRIARRRV